MSSEILKLAALGLLIAGLALIAYAYASRRRVRVATSPGEDAENALTWTRQAGEELGDLSESARCDLVFAVAQLDDPRSRQMLVNALADPSTAVSLAAAHALARQGHVDEVEAYAAAAPGKRSNELLELLSLIA